MRGGRGEGEWRDVSGAWEEDPIGVGADASYSVMEGFRPWRAAEEEDEDGMGGGGGGGWRVDDDEEEDDMVQRRRRPVGYVTPQFDMRGLTPYQARGVRQWPSDPISKGSRRVWS